MEVWSIWVKLGFYALFAEGNQRDLIHVHVHVIIKDFVGVHEPYAVEL